MTQMISTDPTMPKWRKIVAFPLVSLVIALGAVYFMIAFISDLSQMAPAFESSALTMALWVAVSVAALFLFGKLALSELGENPRDDLPMAGAVKDTVLGFAAGGWLITLSVGVAFILGAYEIVGWGTSESAAMIWLQGGVFAGFVEEVISRGIIFRFLEEFAGSWAALVLSSLFFGFMHAGNEGATVFSSVAISIEAGILLGAAYMYTRNLWLAIGIHFGWNVVQGYIWDVPVSGHQVDGLVESQREGSVLLTGGAFGLEASVLALVIATTAGLWLLREAVRKGHVMQPWWTRRRLAREAEVTSE